MKTGKITAKLRDAVPVCLMVNGEEVKRYKNIELPDMLKEVEMTDFHFNVHMDGKITFEIHYEESVLPEVFPEARTRVSRAARAVAKTAMPQPAEDKAAEKKEENIQIGMRVKQAREAARLTQERLAELLDVTAQYISGVERGAVGLSIPILLELSSILLVSPKHSPVPRK